MKRFGFGKNWKNFIKDLSEEQVSHAVACLKASLKTETLAGKTFIDIGSGSGLMSLAAIRMGARVLSFDYDTDSVEATRFMKERFEPVNNSWKIEQGSVLDSSYMSQLGTFDIVYSWGVLHHTGNMWKALENVHPLVNSRGTLFIAIYNNQGFTSRIWKVIKRVYNSSFIGRWLISLIFIPYFYLIGFAADLLKHGNPFYSITHYKSNRGMSVFHDIIDWIGGYPFEVATHAQIFNYYYPLGYNLTYLHSTTSVGCNEFVFEKR